MSKGVVLFALNNSEINYISIAQEAAKRAKHFLNVEVSLITDDLSSKAISDNSIFDKVILIESNSFYYSRSFRDGDESKKDLWKNSHRDSIYELSPYDETLVIDVDFLINTNVLNYCWDQPHDFLIFKDSCDLAKWRSAKEYRYISQYSIPFYWATVFFFRKTETNKIFFSLISHIKDNWSYYNFLYQLSSPMFRNDFAFSIAIHMMNGFSNTGDFAKSLPGKLFYTLDRDLLVEANNKTFIFLLNKFNGSYLPAKVSNIDVHVMNKYSILRTLENE